MDKVNKPLLKKILSIIVVVVLLVGISYSAVRKIQYWESGIYEYDATDFSKYKQSYKTVGKYLRNEFNKEKSKSDLSRLTLIPYGDEGYVLSCEINDTQGYEVVITPPENVENAIADVKKSVYCSDYSGEGSVMFIATKDQIEFRSNYGLYSVIYADKTIFPKCPFSTEPHDSDKDYYFMLSWNFYEFFRGYK